jgi:hypothetical protein
MEDTNCGAGVAVEVEDGRDTSYYCEDFNWEDLRNEMEAKEHQRDGFINLCDEEAECYSNKEAWQSFHERHFRGTFFKVNPFYHIRSIFSALVHGGQTSAQSQIR